MSEKPILFSTPMVQAVQDDRKNQTRRTRGLDEINKAPDKWVFMELKGDTALFINKESGEARYIKFPYGPVGTILWVRETWCENAPTGITRYFYKADEQPEEIIGQMKAFGYRWRPSIHMPREACRIRLEITDLRVQRLQDISEEDARAEGIRGWTKDGSLYKYCVGEVGDNGNVWSEMPYTAKDAFKKLWDSINKDRGHGWDTNPWVLAISFERLTHDYAEYLNSVMDPRD
jgi:hypothetical protein